MTPDVMPPPTSAFPYMSPWSVSPPTVAVNSSYATDSTLFACGWLGAVAVHKAWMLLKPSWLKKNLIRSLAEPT